jgi:hypothetical protein
MAATTIAIRLSAEGAAEIKRALDDVGSSGAAAMQRVGDSSTNARAPAEALRHSLEGISLAAQDVASSAVRLQEAVDPASRAGVAVRDFGIATEQTIAQTSDLAGQVTAAANAYGLIAIGAASATRGTTGMASAFSGLSGVIGATVRAIGPWGLAIGAATAATTFAVTAAAKLNAENAALATSLRAVGRDAEVSTASLSKYVRALQASGVDHATATAAVTQMGRTASLSQATIGQVSSLIPDAAVALGSDTAAAARTLTEAFAGTYDGVKKLDDALNFLSASEREQIRTMLEHGDRAGALKLEFDRLHDRIHGMDETMTGPFEQAMRSLGTSWRAFTDSIATDPNIQSILTLLSNAAGSALRTAAGAITSAASDLQSGVAGDSALEAMQGGVLGAWASAKLSQRRQDRASTLSSADIYAYQDMGSGVGANDFGQADAADQQRQAKVVNDLTAGYRAMRSEIGATADQQKVLTAVQRAYTEAAANGITGTELQRLVMLRANEAVAQGSTVTTKAAQDHARTIETLIADAAGDTASQVALAAAYDVAGTSIAAVTARAKAEDEARKLATSGHAADAAQVAELSAKYLSLAQAQEAVRESKNIRDQQDELDAIAKEAELIGATTEQRARELAVLKERQKVLNAGGDPSDGRASRDITMAGDVAAARAELERTKSTLSELSQVATSTFDQIGTALSTAFATGTAVKWENVWKTAIASVAQQILKLTIINPIVNAAFGTERITASSAASALSGSTSGGSSIVGNLGSAAQLGSGGMKLLGYDIPSLSGIADSINGFGASYLGIGTTTAGLAETPALMAGGANGMIAEGAISSAGTAAGGATLTSTLGGVGAGFGLGTLAGSYLNPGHTDQSMVGAGGGAIAGAAIGSAVPVVGTVLGGIIGGLVGGTGGRFFGPGAPHNGWGYHVTTDNGQLAMSELHYNDVAKDQIASEQQQIAQINAYLSANKLTASGTYIVGGNNTGVAGEVASLGAGTGALRFSTTSDNAALQKVLGGRAFSSFEDLQGGVTAAATFTSLTEPAKVTGTLNEAIAKLNTTFDAAAAQARQYGLSEDDLNAARAKGIKALQDEAAAQITKTDQGYTYRLMVATGDATGASLYQQGINADAERQALAASYKTVYGDAYEAMDVYVAQLGKLNTVLAAERSAIEKQAAETERQATAARQQAAEQAATTAKQALSTAWQAYETAAQQQVSALQSVTTALKDAAAGLRDFETGLNTSAYSPLAPADQLAAARTAMARDVAAAKGGDTTAAGRLQADAQSRLALAQTFYGAATASYAQEFATVQSDLSAVATGLAAEASASQQQVDALNSSVSLLHQQVGLAAETVTSLDRLRSAVLSAFTASTTASAASPTGQVTATYQALLGRTPDATGLAYWVNAMTGGASLAAVTASIKASEEYKRLHGMQQGGWVGNGVWNKDSVLAQFAGGGAIALAGGEYVVSAPQAARYADILPRLNQGRYSNDNSSQAVLAELRALRAELAAMRRGQAQLAQVAAQGHLATVQAVQEGTVIAQQAAGVAKRLSAR